MIVLILTLTLQTKKVQESMDNKDFVKAVKLRGRFALAVTLTRIRN